MVPEFKPERTLLPLRGQLLFNSQFFGADVAALLPKATPSVASLVTFVIVVGMSWVMGYVWAWLYNRIAGWGPASR